MLKDCKQTLFYQGSSKAKRKDRKKTLTTLVLTVPWPSEAPKSGSEKPAIPGF